MGRNNPCTDQPQAQLQSIFLYKIPLLFYFSNLQTRFLHSMQKTVSLIEFSRYLRLFSIFLTTTHSWEHLNFDILTKGSFFGTSRRLFVSIVLCQT